MSIMVEFSQPPGKPALRGIDHFWSVIRGLDGHGPWTVYDIHIRTNRTDRSTVADYVHRLVRGGVAQATGDMVGRGRCSAPSYRLLSSPLRTPAFRSDGSSVQQGRGQAQMWNVMRGPLCRNGFCFRDLVLYGTTDEVDVKPESAKAFVKRLAEAGYLVCLQEGRPRHPAQWKLKPAMNTGPLAPVILRTHVVYDQNLKEAVGPMLGEEVSP